MPRISQLEPPERFGTKRLQAWRAMTVVADIRSLWIVVRFAVQSQSTNGARGPLPTRCEQRVGCKNERVYWAGV
jgi:hypothetical protein